MNCNLISLFQLLKDHCFPSVMVYDLITFEAYSSDSWKDTCMHMCLYMYICVHTLFSVHRDAAFSRSFLVPFVLTCFAPHLCLLYTWQRKPSIYQIFWQNTFLRLNNFLCLLTLVGNKLTQACTLPAGRDALGAVLTDFLACSFSWGPLPRLRLGHLR